MFINRNPFPIITVLFLCSVGLMNCKTTNKAIVSAERKWEGCMLLENKAYTDIDLDGIPINEVSGNDSLLVTAKSKMFFRGKCMIDINEANHVVDGNYTGTDTIGYTLYHFPMQRFIKFKTLSADAEMIKKGSMADTEGSFTNSAALDPMNGIPDSIWRVTDTVINGDSIGMVNFIIPSDADSLEKELLRRGKFWVNYSIKDFPLQISYILSKKLRNGFVYKMQLPTGDGRVVMVTSFNYQPAKLSDTLVKVFEKWARLAAE